MGNRISGREGCRADERSPKVKETLQVEEVRKETLQAKGENIMIQIQQLRLPAPHPENALEKKLLHILRIRESELLSYEIRRHSLDARKKPVLFDVYTVEAEVKKEARVLKRIRSGNVTAGIKEPAYTCDPSGTKPLDFRPVVIGTGPSGLFCGYALARMGYRPVLLERGADMDTRIQDVEAFWKGGPLSPESNVQFGEGGAGAFSDGKLNTLIRDEKGRNKEVLRLFVKYGAPENILYEYKPHIGTDILRDVVKNIRTTICRMGGEVRFHTKAVDFYTEPCPEDSRRERLSSLVVRNTLTNREEILKTGLAVLAVGHSARDTFAMLKDRRVPMKPKAFAAGIRIEHAQAFIDDSQYGRARGKELPAASYKLTANLPDGRGVYTFCMCPGGYVVNASSEEGGAVVNGMSYSGRNGENANSAVVVTVSPEDYGGKDVLSGVEFQRRLERAAFRAGNGAVPVQLLKDFRRNVTSAGPGTVLPQIKGACVWTNVRAIFPDWLSAAIESGIDAFDRKIPGYGMGDAVLSGVESRTSSPIRILRNENLESAVQGIYPCGEGAGYAGGITSAATDGLKVAEAVSRIYRPFDTEDQA